MLVAERDRGRRFDLAEIFLGVGDETMLRILSGEVQHPGFVLRQGKGAPLAQGILDRDLFHRAFAFRGRFIAAPPGLSSETTDKNRRVLWRRIVSNLSGLRERYELGLEIYEFALRCSRELAAAKIDSEQMIEYAQCLEEIGPEQIIVDVPALKADRISILARFPNGALKIPEFSFNPVKWSDAYELQKRTGYVYCPRSVVEIVGLASKIVFLGRFGVAMNNDADGFIKATSQLSEAWLSGLVGLQLIDQKTADRLVSKRHSLLAITPDDLAIPESWVIEDNDIADRTTVEIAQHLSGGLTAEDIEALTRVLKAFYAFIDLWFDGGHAARPLQNEEELQRMLRDALAIRGLSVDEGTKVGGGKLDLFVEDAVLVENKFHGKSADPAATAGAAGMQGRRYAISLRSQVVIVVLAYESAPATFPNKSETMSIHGISTRDSNRVEIRFSLPYGAVIPSREKTDRAARKK
jgi:hypothetical protein